MRRGAVTLVGLVAAVALFPTAARAEMVTLGSDLAAAPGTQGGSGLTRFQVTLPNRTLTSPCPGTVAHWRLRGKSATALAQTAVLRVLHPGGAGKYTATARSASLAVGTADAVFEADTNLAIAAGDSIGMDVPMGGVVFLATNPNASYASFAPELADNGPPTAPSGQFPGTELTFNADVTCTPPTPTPTPTPTPPTPTPTPPPAPGVPVLSGLSLSPASFRAFGSGPSIATSRGTTVRYALSVAAVVKFQIERSARGRRVAGKCVKPTKPNAAKKRCTRYSTLTGSFTHQGKAGSNAFKFRGRLGARTLKAGSYRLLAAATDAAGRSMLKRIKFRIVKR